MATLEKIRSKSVLLFTIIIVALLAFILGDFLTSGRTYFGSGTTVAQAGKAKVDYTEFKNSIDAASAQARNGNQDVDNDELTQQVISELLFKQMLDNEYEQLGITVTDSEISNAMTGAMPHRAAQQFIYTVSQQLGLPQPSGAAVYDAMMNPAKYSLTPEIGAQLKQMWAAQESQVAEQLKQEKFYRLIGGLFTASEVDARALYDDTQDTRHIAYTTKDYSTIPDDKVSVTDDDIKAEWAKEKALYRIAEPTRTVDYIIVMIEPSKEDRLAGQKEVEDALVALNAQPGTDGINGNTRFVTNRVSAARSQISDNNVKAFVDSASIGQAALLSHVRDTYTLAKLLGTSTDVDSINVSVIAGAQGTSLDSVLTELNAGAEWAKFINTESTQGQDSVWTTLVNNTALTPSTKALLMEAAPGVPFIATDTIQGQAYSAIYRVNRRHAPVTVYDVAVATYTIDPSSNTIAQLTGDLNKFIGENSNAADFSANAAEAGYNLLSALVSASTPHVGPIADSRGTVKWVMDAKKGQVSPVVSDSKQSYLLTVAVKDIYDGEYLPWDCYAFTDRLKARAINTKKAEQLMAQYKGKASDVAGYAKAMGTEVSEGDASFMSPILATIGLNESALQGQIAAAKEGVTVGPTVGNNSIVVFQVKSTGKPGRPYDFNEYGARFNQTLGTGLFNPFQLLLGDEKVENHSLNFVQSSVN